MKAVYFYIRCGLERLDVQYLGGRAVYSLRVRRSSHRKGIALATSAKSSSSHKGVPTGFFILRLSQPNIEQHQYNTA